MTIKTKKLIATQGLLLIASGLVVILLALKTRIIFHDGGIVPWLILFGVFNFILWAAKILRKKDEQSS